MLGLEKLSNLSQRILTGVLGVALFVGAMSWNAWSFTALFFMLMVLSLWEFYGLLEKAGYRPPKTIAYLLAILVFVQGEMTSRLLFALLGIYFLEFSSYLNPVILVVCSSLFVVKIYDKTDNKPFESIAFVFLSLVYVAIPFTLISGLGYPLKPIVFAILFCLWANDTGAYFAGKALGKTKLFERISPKKTWEGFFGGLVAALLLSAMFHYLYQDTIFPFKNGFGPWKWYAIGATMAIVGTFGDLTESMLKRSLSIKDSGRLIPGHGGFLDRFDGLLIAMPVVFFILFVL